MSSRALIDPAVLSHTELVSLVERLLAENATLKQLVSELRDENAQLKGLKGRPPLKPSGMEQATEPKRPAGKKPGRKRSKTARLTIDEDRLLPACVPAGSRFKGYESFVVQDLVLRPHVIRFRRERWVTPAGTTVVAPLPLEIDGHFGPQLKRFVLAQYHQGQVTIPRLLAQLHALGLQISKRQLVRLLTTGHQTFRAEKDAILRAGLATARWITVDDTGARHQNRNGVTTQIGNAHFAWFATTADKSRRNFLELLRAGYGDYAVNDAALAYMRRRQLPLMMIERLAAHPTRRFADAAAWQAHLTALGIRDRAVHPDPVQIATEGALWGSIVGHGLLPDTVIVSDDAGQFAVGRHALCWVHAERTIHKLICATARQRAEVDRVRLLIWWLYRDLKAYRRDPSARAKASLKARFDRLFGRKTSFELLNRALARLKANKAELLAVLDRPEIPLHTNGSENDLRCQVIKRKISGGTKSDAGRDARDIFLSLSKTCAKLGVSFWTFLGDRLRIPDAPTVPVLPDLIRRHAAMA